jgi:hypothetical protein
VGTESRDAKKKLLELDEPDSPSSARALESGGAASSTVRERMATVTDDDALEQARLQSLPSNLPPARRPMSTVPAAAGYEMNDGGIDVEIDSSEDELDVLPVGEQIYMLRARLAPLTRVPQLTKPLTELGALLADPKTAYVLGFVDGILPLDTIIDVTGLPEVDTLRVLERMVSQGVVLFRTS